MSVEKESKKVKLTPTTESFYPFETSDTSDQVTFRGAELHFLGTSSSVPTRERNTSAIALKLEGEVWLFDCGEGVQKQLLFTSVPRTRISRIFITHMHGDHCFGLPPLLCSLSIVEHVPRPHIYGPIGIREFIEKTLSLTRSPTIPSTHIHEYTPTQLPDGGGTLSIHEDERWSVRAGWIRHKIPCLGFIIEERASPGSLLMDRALKMGLKPGTICAQLKNGQSIQLENGTIIHPDQVMTHPRKGRKLVILGDNSDASSLKLEAEHADLVVHESTLDQDMQELAVSKGHSTSRMAGLFAKQVKAKSLVLTHFSPRFHSDKSERTETGIRTDSTLDQETLPLVEQARAAFESDHVFAAKDRWWISIPRHEVIRRTIEEDRLLYASQMKDANQSE
jgi:ribonuclease Z